MDALVPYGGRVYWFLVGVLLFARGMDFLSTWIGTPGLLLEANPLARRLGWRWGLAINLALCAAVACWPLPSLVIATASLMVAARNFQSAWLMRSMGEHAYRDWIGARVREAPAGLYLACLFAQAALTILVGAALLRYGGDRLVPFAVGAGMVTYAVAVVFYTSLALWRTRRAVAGFDNKPHRRGHG